MQILDKETFFEFLAQLSAEDIRALYYYVSREKMSAEQRADINQKRAWIREYLSKYALDKS